MISLKPNSRLISIQVNRLEKMNVLRTILEADGQAERRGTGAPKSAPVLSKRQDQLILTFNSPAS